MSAGGWFKCPASAWPTVLEAVRAQRPLERDEAIADLRWQLDQRGDVESRRALAKRWGWSEWATRDLLASDREWRVDVRPVAAQVPPAGRPANAHQKTGEAATPREIRPPAAHRPPSDLPAASTRAVDPDCRPQTPDPDQSQSEARTVRAEAVASVLAGWLGQRGIGVEERATWEAGGEAFLRRLRKAVDGERHVGALGLPDLRAGIRLALARYDERSAAAVPALSEPETTPGEPEWPSGDPDWPDEDEPAAAGLSALPERRESDADRLCDLLQRSTVAPAWSRSWTVADVERRLRPAWSGAAVVVDPPATPVGVRNLLRVAEAANLRIQWRNQ